MDAYIEDQKAIERRRKIAEAMMARGQAPIEVPQAGGVPTPINWTQGLANMANAYLGRQGINKAEQEEKSLAGQYETAQSDELKGIIDALSKQQPAIPAPADALGGGPGRPEIPQTPEQKNAILVNAYLGSKYPQAQKTLPLLLAQNNAEISREDTQQAARDAAKLKYEDAATARQEKINADIAAAKMAIDAKADAASKHGDLLKALKGRQQTTLGKPPPGYRWTADGNQEAIPGGPKDMSVKNKALNDTLAIKAKIVTEKIDEALAETGFFSTGLIGEVTGIIPGTPGYNLDATLDTIKANIGFNELQAMRQASPTGGALGQVAVRELDMLQAVLSSLKKGQSEDKLRANLGKVKTHYENWKKAVDQSAVEEGGQQPVPQTGNSIAPSGVPPELWNVMTPEEKKAWQQ